MSKRLLVVDDSLFIRNLMRDILQAEGFIVVAEAEDGEEGVLQYKKYRPDLVIMNIVMPKMSGLKALAAIMAWDPNATIIMCSAMMQPPVIFSAIQQGAKDFVPKPFDSHRLVQSVSQALGFVPVADA